MSKKGKITSTGEPSEMMAAAAHEVPAATASAGVVSGLDRYLGHIAHLDLPLEVKINLIRVLHEMMRSFVDRAFGEDPVQLAVIQADIKNNIDASPKADMLNSSPHLNLDSKYLTGGLQRNAEPWQEKATEQ